LRTRDRGKRKSRHEISEWRQIESRRRVDAMALARAHVAAIMASRGRMFVAALNGSRTVCGIVHRAITVGREGGRRCGRGAWRRRGEARRCSAGAQRRRDSMGARRCRHIQPRRTRRHIQRRLGRLQRQPHNQLKREQHKQCSFRGQNFCGMASHATQLNPKRQKVTRRHLHRAPLRRRRRGWRRRRRRYA
jgi:hypothetical protein